ncbi:MAG: hypothetical protein ACRBBR_09400 [Cellvibrionaceae bacterium]
MSFDLGFLAFYDNKSDEEVKNAYLSINRGQLVEWPSNKEFEAFINELSNKFPLRDNALTDEQLDNSPWSCTPYLHQGFLCISLGRGKTANEAADLLDNLVKEYSIFLYDPQSNEVVK